MKILFAAGEAAPLVKVGGLGDVAGALPKTLCAMGHDVRVIMPMYSIIGDKKKDCKYITHIYVNNSWRKQYCGIYEYKWCGVTYYLIDNEYYFDRPKVYGEFDDGERFAFFSRAVLDVLPVVDFIPEILHCNDWHTALVPVLLDTQYRTRPDYANIKTVFTIHNIEFQGRYDPYILGDVFGFDEEHKPLLEYGGCINLVKGAIECSNKVTTVSATYANEILDPQYSFGLEHILSARKYKLSGIVNGIDVDVFNPETDKRIKTNYTINTLNLKYHNKFALQTEMGLEKTNAVPLIGMVTRLTHQKGMDLVIARLDWLMSQDVQVIILGSGDETYENQLKYYADKYPDKLVAYIGFDAELAQRIYAGVDFFLMPSEFEPCGLAQLIALRYGTIPIVRATGGLADTVIPFDHKTGQGNGINFSAINCDEMADAIWRAIELYHNKKHFTAIRKNAMSGDYSWTASGKKYLELYESII